MPHVVDAKMHPLDSGRWGIGRGFLSPGRRENCDLSQPINLGANVRLRHLLEHPAALRRQRRLLTGTITIRACASICDVAQITIIGLALRPMFPAAAETFSLSQSFALALLAAALAVATRRSLRSRNNGDFTQTQVNPQRAALATFAAVALLSAICWVTLSQSITPNPQCRTAWFLTWAIASSLTAAGLRYAMAHFAERLECGNRIVIIGSPEHVDPIACTVDAAPNSLFRLAGRFDDRKPGAFDAVAEIIARGGVDRVLLALNGPDAADRIAAVCDKLADQPVRVSLALDPSTLAGFRGGAASRDRLPLIDIADDPHGGVGGVVKRYLDVGLAAFVLLLTAPVTMLTALAIKLDSRGPILFRQWRFGVGSQPILVLKFRTMRTEAGDENGAARTLARDPRVTRVGRFLRRTSIDELPQLFNVLRGDMSLVGPRPHPLHMRVGDTYYFEAVAHYRARHLIRPGITGWAQINGSRGAVDTIGKARRRVELDLYYVEHWSLWLDLRILVLTALGGFLSLDAD
jgi:Undecaprenyl-phosphate glucose phosphotransferase